MTSGDVCGVLCVHVSELMVCMPKCVCGPMGLFMLSGSSSKDQHFFSVRQILGQ